MSATKILLVNDDEVAGMALAEVLGQSGFVVTCAAVSPHSDRVFRAVVCLPGSLAQGHDPRYR
jgi:CheY-like chemotaxis protein